MGIPNYARSNEKSPMSIIIHAEALTNYIFHITANEKQFPKSFRYTLSADIKNTSMKLVKLCYKGLSIKPRYRKQLNRRIKIRQEVYETISELKALFHIAVVNANVKNKEHLAKLLQDVIDGLNHWAKSDNRQYKNIPSKKEYQKRLQEAYRKRREEKEWLSNAYRDENGFIRLQLQTLQ